MFYLLEKSETFTIFKKFKNLAEKETCELIRCLRTDIEGEFTSNEFNELCNSDGIKRQLTVAYILQQNKVIERKNRSIMNLTKNMLSKKKIPKEFWHEAIKVQPL